MQPTSNFLSINEQIERLNTLVDSLIRTPSVFDKIIFFNQDPIVGSFIEQTPYLKKFLIGLSPACELVIKSILAIGQGSMVFQQKEQHEIPYEELRSMIEQLIQVEQFYENIGGIVGYHLAVLKLIAEKKDLILPQQDLEMIEKPEGIDLTKNSSAVNEIIRFGIESFPQMAEIYPVGGAGDRLQLRNEETGELLPVAQLQFCGRSLLEGLVRDLQGREYLYYKMTGKQILTPIAMMTSHEKKNHERIQGICRQANWFFRPKESFDIFTQPLVPVISEDGNWCLSTPFNLCLKPGGHGVLWKLAKDKGVFTWFQSLNRNKILVRQINNPIAGIDKGFTALIGQGCKHNKSFGFASCFRILNTAEGMNVFVQKQIEEGVKCCITNIEYCDFALKNIDDIPSEENCNYSLYPANTNILFADIKAVETALKECSLPGMLINMKTEMECIDVHGNPQTIHGGRLETTMQNLADYIVDYFPNPLKENEQDLLKTYVTYNDRHKTISVTKKSYVPGKPLLETPEGCFYDVLKNAHELLTNFCHWKMPPLVSIEDYIKAVPPFHVQLHPALGPLYSITAQKLRNGELKQGGELILEIAEIDVNTIVVDGSLIVHALSPLGHINHQGCIEYSEHCGKCTLRNVTIKNKGINWSIPQVWWKGKIMRNESFEIVLHGNGEFYAENVNFAGNHFIEVPDGYRYEALASNTKSGFDLIKEKIKQPTWHWEYGFSEDDTIHLKKITQA